MKNYYELLQVDKKASQEVIKKVYNYHIKKNHPDLYKGEDKEIAKTRTQEFTEAYDILSNPEKRKEYDENLSLVEQQKTINQNLIIELQNENQYLRKKLYEKEYALRDIYKNTGEIERDFNYYSENNNVDNETDEKKESSLFKYYVNTFKNTFLRLIMLVIFILICIIGLYIIT